MELAANNIITDDKNVQEDISNQNLSIWKEGYSLFSFF